MKKLIAVTFVIFLVVGISVFFISEYDTAKDLLFGKGETTTAETTTAAITEESAEEATYDDKSQPVFCNTLYHISDYSELEFITDTENKAVELIQHIHSPQYFSAGTTIKHNLVAGSFIRLASMDKSRWSEIPAHLDKMTPEQLDFLSFRIYSAFRLSLEFFSGEPFKVSYLEGTEMVWNDQECYDVSMLTEFLNYMTILFDERGVEYEWIAASSSGCDCFYY